MVCTIHWSLDQYDEQQSPVNNAGHRYNCQPPCSSTSAGYFGHINLPDFNSFLGGGDNNQEFINYLKVKNRIRLLVRYVIEVK